MGCYQRWKVRRLVDKWTRKCPPDTVLLHTTPRCIKVPSISPYALKLETYLRMAKIPYELDTTDPIGPKGKLPWISYNGKHVSDSQLIIEFLGKEFGINLHENVSSDVLAAAKACRLLLENHFYWGTVQFQWVENSSTINQHIKLPTLYKVFMPLMSRQMKGRLVDNGMGAHSPSEIYAMTNDDLRAVSAILGSKQYFGGEDPCEEDAGIFCWIALVLNTMAGSSFEKLVNGELSNLQEYFERVKARFWSDWDSCLDRS